MLFDIEKQKEWAKVTLRGESLGVFFITMRVKKIAGVKHPCPRDGKIKCRLALEFADSNGAVWTGLLHYVVIAVERETIDFIVSGRIPFVVASGYGVVKVSISVSTLPQPVFSYEIPVLIE